MIRPIIWIPAAVLLAVVLFFIISYTNPPAPATQAGPALTRKEEKAVLATIDKQHERAAKDTVAAHAATAAAKQSHAVAHSLRQQAIAVHQKSKPHASPIPATDTALARLQRELASFGDR